LSLRPVGTTRRKPMWKTHFDGKPTHEEQGRALNITECEATSQAAAPIASNALRYVQRGSFELR
jgi:hypothetical protein